MSKKNTPKLKISPVIGSHKRKDTMAEEDSKILSTVMRKNLTKTI